jgi:hypothetical protein
VAGGA